MLRTLRDEYKAGIFAILVLALAILCAAINQPLTLALYMFIPTLATGLMLLVITREGYQRAIFSQLGLRRSGWRSWGLALLLPLIVLGGAYAAIWKIVPASFQGFAYAVKWPNLALYLLGLLILQTLTFSLGEELGWRGYLLPKLLVFGRLPAYLLGGLLWAVWHYPLIFIANAYNTEGNTAITTILFTLVVLPLSVIFGELRLRSNSVWPAALIHSAHNIFWGQFMLLSTSAPAARYIAGESGVLTILLYTLAAMLLLRWRRPVAAL